MEKQQGTAAEQVIRAGRTSPPKLTLSGKGKRWSGAAEAVFLDALAASANVTYAAKQARFSTEAIYKRRRTYPGFAVKWSEALAIGYVRLEALLVETANDTLTGKPIDPKRPVPRMSVSEAMNLLAQHRNAVKGDGRTRGRAPCSIDPQAAREEILRNVAALRRARERGRG